MSRASSVAACETPANGGVFDFSAVFEDLDAQVMASAEVLPGLYALPHVEPPAQPAVAVPPASRPQPLDLRLLSAHTRVDTGSTHPFTQASGMLTPPSDTTVASPFLSPASIASTNTSSSQSWPRFINPQKLTPKTPAFSGGIFSADPPRVHGGDEANVDGTSARLAMPASNVRGTAGPYPRANFASPFSAGQQDRVKGMTTCPDPPPSPSDFVYKNRTVPAAGPSSEPHAAAIKTRADGLAKKRSRLDFELVPSTQQSHDAETAPRPFNNFQYIPPPQPSHLSRTVTPSPVLQTKAWDGPSVPLSLSIGNASVPADPADVPPMYPRSSSLRHTSSRHNEDDVSMREYVPSLADSGDDDDDVLDSRDASDADNDSQSGESEGENVRCESVDADPSPSTPLRELSASPSAAGSADSDYVPLTTLGTRGIGRARPAPATKTPSPKTSKKAKPTPPKSTPKRPAHRSTKSKLGFRTGERRMCQNRNAQKKYRDKNRRLADYRADFNVDTIAIAAKWKKGKISASEAMEFVHQAAQTFREDIKETCAMTGNRLEDDVAAAIC